MGSAALTTVATVNASKGADKYSARMMDLLFDAVLLVLLF
jgi:hypothetical protein